LQQLKREAGKPFYCGIDLHSNNHIVVVIDEKDNKVVDKRIDNNLNITLALLALYEEQLRPWLSKPLLTGIGS
tara:strand:- start:1583 stop:1801 length:219 start_codon:yes stop_codon:yes gene_type:complete